jgi:hypothetical protein
MSWPADAVEAHYRRLKEPVPDLTKDEPKPAPKPTGRTPWTPKMNANERAYASYLLARKLDGDVLWFGFQAITILYGPDCRFTPDFLILFSDSRLELHDTKGASKIKTGKRAGENTFWAEEAAKIKTRVTAGNFPIPIYFVWSLGNGGWGKKGFGE